MRYFIYTFLLFIGLHTSCTVSKLNHNSNNKIFKEMPIPTLVDNQLNSWQHRDIVADQLPGISSQRLYDVLSLDRLKQSDTVIVAVMDSGIDIYHEDLKDNIWVNKNEIPNNNIDDDRNGYIDDVHGWNFLGNKNGKNINFARLESVRILLSKGYDFNSSNDTTAIKALDSITQLAAKDYKRRVGELKGDEVSLKGYTSKYNALLEFFKQSNPNDSLTLENVSKIDTINKSVAKKNVNALYKMIKNGQGQLINEYANYIKVIKNYKLNPNYDDRKVIGDNVYDTTDVDYGNNDIVGDLAIEKHGTLVAGLIAASRDNNIGIQGVAKKVKIMPLRVIPNGDEYDKDVAMAIRYAVDNGAKIINMSFGKRFSPQREMVYNSIKYAADHNVLLVNAAGNEGINIDKERFYPNDKIEAKEISHNFISVGALNYKLNKKLPAYFSNYGKENLDIFAPGYKIYTTAPNNKYEVQQGTSLSAPIVSGAAALIWSLFPDLSAVQLKNILLESGNKYDIIIRPPSLKNERIPFKELSKTGSSLNVYNAFLLAEQITKK